MALMTSTPLASRLRRGLWSATAILLLSTCALVTGSFTRSVAAQSVQLATQAGDQKPASGKDLSCTYYDDRNDGHPGTCGYDPDDKTKYRCYANEDRSKSNSQIACKAKVLRATEQKK